jgi:glyoxylase-like metal-dependent hydrolase (beta-lactamase superfamily II)
VEGVPDDPADTTASVAGVYPEGDAPEEIEPGIWRIPLPLPMALRSVNLYLLGGAGEWALVDAGLGTPEGEAALRAGLQRVGIRLEDIGTLVLTHAHPDHIGLAGDIHAAAGAPVHLLAEEADHIFRIWDDPEMHGLRIANAMFATHGLPADDADLGVRGNQRLRRLLHLPPRAAVAAVTEGESLRLAGRSYRVLWTPGHADHHLCLLREDGVLIAGDHVLPRITPNIGLYPNARPNPLRDYFSSLTAVRDLPVRLVLPGHGRPFANLPRRVDELRAHHEARASEIVDLLRARPAGSHAFALAVELFGERLSAVEHRRFALAETLAHLEDLRERGLVRRRDDEAQVLFAAAPAMRRRA